MKARTLLIAAVAMLFFAADQASAAPIFLDMDSLATGSGLGTMPLATPFGNITFVGEFRDRDGDPDFNAAGALGDVLDIDNFTNEAELFFDFDVTSITFIYGGNVGVADFRALDEFGGIVDSFFQASTDDGEPAGPITLAGSGIRSLFWKDPGGSLLMIDNVTIDAIPEPSGVLLFGVGMLVVSRALRRRAA